jgi:lysophospholipase L1-like esterase
MSITRYCTGLLGVWLAAFITPVRGASADDATFLLTHGRVVFVGDSITYSGQYVEYLETALRLKFPDRHPVVLNLGLPSETVSGLSEPGHAGGQFPRPDLHERLSRLLEQAKPDVVVACYGMNDGIYHPLGEERFAAFRSGIERLHAAVTRAGARIIHITPPTFDAVPIRGQTLPAGLKEYRSPYEGYNQVLDRYAQWLMERRAEGWRVIDIHTPMNRRLEEARKSNPGFRFAGDGVHIDAAGHWLITQTILRDLGLDAMAEGQDFEHGPGRDPRAAKVLESVQKRQRALKDTWLTHVGHKRPGMAKGASMESANAVAAEMESRIEQALKTTVP